LRRPGTWLARTTGVAAMNLQTRLERFERRAAVGAAAPAPPAARVATWIFDLDNTLYSPACDLTRQFEQRAVQFICARSSVDGALAPRVRERYIEDRMRAVDQMVEQHGVTPAEFFEYVHAVDLSGLTPDPRLSFALRRLPGR